LLRPADDAARSIAREYLGQWAEARRRLEKADDPEALHEFRVALRRLRATLRAFRQELQPRVPRRTRRRLRRLAEVTMASRDLQVERAWLVAQLDALGPEERAGAQWLAARWETRQRAADEQVARRVAKDFARVDRGLHRAFEPPGRDATGEDGRSSRTAGAVLRETLREWTAELDRRFQAIHTLADWDDAHAARITVKRLRYLLEPLKQEVSGAEPTIAQLTELQNLLGELQDAHALTDALRAAFAEVAVREARCASDHLLPWPDTQGGADDSDTAEARAGLIALSRRLRGQAEERLAQVMEWLDRNANELLSALRDLGRPSGQRSSATSRRGARAGSQAVERPSTT